MFLLTIAQCLLIHFTMLASSAHGDEKPPPASAAGHKKNEEGIQNLTSQLFAPCDAIRVLPPSRFPKPTKFLRHENATVVVEPSFGRHNRTADAVLAYAEGYALPYYRMFLETLQGTGFRGDVVLAVAEPRLVEADAELYLREFAEDATNPVNLVVYQMPLECDNGDVGEPESTQRRMDRRADALDIFQMCRLPRVYGIPLDDVGGVKRVVPQPDSRHGRVVATIRYEWYWIWSLQYDPRSWLMLLDARDSFFQTNPFAGVPRSPHNKEGGGILWLFGENHEATRLGKSTKNLKWLRGAYGPAVLEALSDKPTICSGSTMGEQIALETYLRAMVNEHDECDIRMTGSDQGFHNYLYYSGKLLGATDTIRQIVVWEQGKGAINNLGALRTKPLKEWGIYNSTSHDVYQWDGSLSPVAHQFDRDSELHSWMMRQRHKEWKEEWQRLHPKGTVREVAAR